MVRLQLPKIYPITDAGLSGLSHLEQVRALIDGGARIIQIREKSFNAADWIGDVEKAVRLAREAGVPIIINDRVDVAIVVGANGVHLGQNDLPPAAARRMLGDGAIVGYSTHTLAQVHDARDLPIDYIAFGPIFSTKSKTDADPTVGLRLLTQAISEAGDIPIVAIGGIDRSNVHEVFESGADSAAVIGAIMALGGEIANELKILIDSVC